MKRVLLSLIAIVSISFFLGCDDDSNPTGSNGNNNKETQEQYPKDERLIVKWEMTMGVSVTTTNGNVTFDTTHYPEDSYRYKMNLTESNDDIWKSFNDTLFTDVRNAGSTDEYWGKEQLYSFRGDTLVLFTVYGWGDEIALDEAPSSYWIPVIQ